MERFLNAIKTWPRDPEVVFSLSGAVVGATGIMLFLSGVFPLNPVNFWFFSTLLLLLGLYRPNWCFLLLVAVAPFEIITIAPDSVGLSLRPYQWVFLALALALGVRMLSGKSRFPLFPLSRLDYFLALIPMGALVSGAIGGGQGLRLGVIVVSFYMLYLLGRVFLKTTGDVRIAAATLFASGLMTALYGIVQNTAFERGVVLQAVMPGRPNALFAEPDWLGFFMALLLVIALARLASALWRSAEKFADNWARLLLAALLLFPIVIALILTVSRSAWLAAVSGILAWALATVLIRGKESLRLVLQSIQILLIVSVIALVMVVDIPLTRFDLFQRAESTATGLQEITIACEQPTLLPDTIGVIDELAAFGCRHINLEERSALQLAGFSIQTVRRPDPNIVIRSEIYARTWKEIRAHPVFGIGWGNIGAVLGTDEHGAAYNASNVWLEIILGAGMIGLIGLLGSLGFVAYRVIAPLLQGREQPADMTAVPLVIAFLAIFFVFNLFNAGLLIGFVWLAFAALPPLLPSSTPEPKAL
jgi:hypothetical protein